MANQIFGALRLDNEVIVVE